MSYGMILAIPVEITNNFVMHFPIIAIAIVISAAIVALLYMIGNVLQSQDILAMGKDSLANLIFTLVILLSFLWLFEMFSLIASALTGASNILEAAHQGVLLFRTKMFVIYMNLYFYEIIFGFLSTFGFQIPLSALDPVLSIFKISVPSLSFVPLSGLTPLSNAHTVVVEAVGTALIMIIARQVLLEFIMNYMHLFFIMGIVMRAFIFTRRTGSSLLAFAAVAYFVYPVAVLTSNYMVFDQYQASNFGVVPTTVGYCDDPKKMADITKNFETERDSLYKSGASIKHTPWYAFWEGITNVGKFIFDTLNEMLKTFLSFNALLISGMVLSPVLFSTFFDFLIMEVQIEVQFLVLIFVTFVFEIIITLTAYRSVALMIDGEAEIFGISKLI
ncbi:MAG: hypothetical protein ACOZBG_04735 [Candidatus Micrarchaeota archaeon]